MKAIKVKGKSKPQRIFAVIGRKDNPDCPKSLHEIRELLGIPNVDLNSVNPDAEEKKYEL